MQETLIVGAVRLSSAGAPTCTLTTGTCRPGDPPGFDHVTYRSIAVGHWLARPVDDVEWRRV